MFSTYYNAWHPNFLLDSFIQRKCSMLHHLQQEHRVATITEHNEIISKRIEREVKGT